MPGRRYGSGDGRLTPVPCGSDRRRGRRMPAARPNLIRRGRAGARRTSCPRRTSPAAAPNACRPFWRRRGLRAPRPGSSTVLPPTSRMTSPVLKPCSAADAIRVDVGDHHTLVAGAGHRPAGASVRPRRGTSVPDGCVVRSLPRLRLLDFGISPSVSDDGLVLALAPDGQLDRRARGQTRRSAWPGHGRP